MNTEANKIYSLIYKNFDNSFNSFAKNHNKKIIVHGLICQLIQCLKKTHARFKNLSKTRDLLNEPNIKNLEIVHHFILNKLMLRNDYIYFNEPVHLDVDLKVENTILRKKMSLERRKIAHMRNPRRSPRLKNR
jgi:hypothetical protein